MTHERFVSRVSFPSVGCDFAEVCEIIGGVLSDFAARRACDITGGCEMTRGGGVGDFHRTKGCVFTGGCAISHMPDVKSQGGVILQGL
jgi:hypothetical protein